jgi:hypothetical protein
MSPRKSDSSETDPYWGVGIVAGGKRLYYDSAGRPEGRPLQNGEKASEKQIPRANNALRNDNLKLIANQVKNERSGAYNFTG